MSQFCETGRMRAGNSCPFSQNVGFPVLGDPAGYGMLQLDPITSTADLWNWQTNVADWQQRASDMSGPAQYVNETDKDAYPFWIRQVRHWNQWNADHSDSKLPAPTDDIYSNIGSPDPNAPPPGTGHATYICGFTLPLDPISSAGLETPTNGAMLNWFGDAVLIKQMGGVAKIDSAQYIRFASPPSTPSWPRNFRNGVTRNLVYEVCSCTTATPQNDCVRLGN